MRTVFSLIGLLLVSAALAGPAPALERLDYQVQYRGLFSAGAEVSIADVHLLTRRPGEGAYLETEMGVSSADYAAVEAFYPIRYLFRSWYPQDRSGSLVYEYQETNNQSAAKHKLTYFDQPGEPYVTHDLVAMKDKMDLPALRAGQYPVAADLARFDRLGLLQHVRGRPLSVGDEMRLSVSNGRQLLNYRVKVETTERIEVAGLTWEALKLRFDGFETDERERERAAHRPIYIWLSQDMRRLPLLAVSRHSLGRFSVILRGGDGVPVGTQVVLDSR